jgi:hypothetical protein
MTNSLFADILTDRRTPEQIAADAQWQATLDKIKAAGRFDGPTYWAISATPRMGTTDELSGYRFATAEIAAEIARKFSEHVSGDWHVSYGQWSKLADRNASASVAGTFVTIRTYPTEG